MRLMRLRYLQRQQKRFLNTLSWTSRKPTFSAIQYLRISFVCLSQLRMSPRNQHQERIYQLSRIRCREQSNLRHLKKLYSRSLRQTP
ncbi:hypothetical protein FGO68_gene6290 [Halteria grandinella]|uniref:Uncharacterized protein n=1 Tax=Halteria grandinella TaxID=5974 RepID=A0A8J8NZR9_HALGN|nr:hypothetical protein FGO68_gene6290 [Halteria grandinella]